MDKIAEKQNIIRELTDIKDRVNKKRETLNKDSFEYNNLGCAITAIEGEISSLEAEITDIQAKEKAEKEAFERERQELKNEIYAINKEINEKGKLLAQKITEYNQKYSKEIGWPFGFRFFRF